MVEGAEALRLLYGTKKPWLFVETAAEIAASAGVVEQLLRLLLDRKRPWVPDSPLPTSKEWLLLIPTA